MDPLYKIVKQLSEEEFEDIYQNLTSSKAEKSALFLAIIRKSDNPVEEFLDSVDISASAFYVLKSRLNQKVESFLLNKLGDPNLEAVYKVLQVNEVLFNSPREIAITTLKKMEKTMMELDDSSALMVVYHGLKMLYNHEDEQRIKYERLYNQSVAYYLAKIKGMEAVMNFFRVYARYYLGRKDKDLQEMIRIMEKIHNVNNLYDSKRLFICKSVIDLYATQFIDVPDRVYEIIKEQEETYEKSFEILKNANDDLLFKHLHLIFDYLRYVFFLRNKDEDKARMYYELLDYKVPELLSGFNFGMDCSSFLFFKLEKHKENGAFKSLSEDEITILDQINIEPSDVQTYLNLHLFKAYVAYYERKYDDAARVLYRVRNELNLRKHPHMDVEVKLFLALMYVLMDEHDLANQLILSLTRQLKKAAFENYDNARLLVKILTRTMGIKTAKRKAMIEKHIEEFNEMNHGRQAILPHLELSIDRFESLEG